MDLLNEENNKTFEDIKHIDENGIEYWLARELQVVLEYSQWRRFEEVIKKAKVSCETSKIGNSNDFADVGKIVKAGAMSKVIKDYKLSRYACYIVVQNGDVRKSVIALGQTYFAIQTRKQELNEKEYQELNEIEKRLYIRKQTKNKNLVLYQVAKKSGVKNFDKFTNAGYKGLYNGETADDIAKRKGLRYREDILDNMGSDELISNLFRISQTEQKITNENIKGEKNANDAHLKVGKIIRQTIKKLGGNLPEELPTPEKSLKQIEKENKRNLPKIKN